MVRELFYHAGLVLAVMAVGFAAGILLRMGTELSILIAALAGALAHGAGVPVRHIVEGTFTYFDVVLIFITATYFMNLLKESGGVSYIVRGIIRRFHRSRFMLLLPPHHRDAGARSPDGIRHRNCSWWSAPS